MPNIEFRLYIECEGAVLQNESERSLEVARLLRNAATIVEEGFVEYHTQPLLDINGNRVGGFRYHETED
jgi:hypothetical protein